MDFSAFSDENFNVKDWVNSVLTTSEASNAENKEAYASQLVVKLQLFIQEINNALEDTSQQVLQNLPRVIRDGESIHQEVSALQTQMKSVRDDIAKVEHDTAQSMQTLLRVDGIKSRMQSASKALREADNWTTLSVEVEDVFLTGDFHSISTKLQGMQQSLKILVDIPDYEERSQHLEDLKNRLEAMISPHLIAAINSQTVDAAQIYVKIFRDIERLPELQKYYHKCQKGQLLQKWKEIVESDPDSTVINWMTIFYDTLLSQWHSQMKWFSQVFPELNSVLVVSGLLRDTLNCLEPSIGFCINGRIKQQGNHTLNLLIDLKQIVERFARSLALATKSYSAGSDSSESVRKLAETIYTPFKQHSIKFSLYVERFLLSKLDTVPLKSDDPSDTVSLLNESVLKIFGFVDEANEYCLQFTNGCCYPGLLAALKIFFGNYVDRVQHSIGLWRDSLRLEDVSLSSSTDWSFLQQSLQGVQACGEITLQLETLDQNLNFSVTDCCKKLGYSSTNLDDSKRDVSDFLKLDTLLLEPRDATAFLKLIEKINDDGDCSLLHDTKQAVSKLCEAGSKVVLEIFFNEIKLQLASLHNMKIWTQENPSGVLTNDLPTFGLSPQEYITQVGQYLMTVPQHIEPFTLQENPAIQSGLKLSKVMVVPARVPEPNQDGHIADHLLNCIALRTCNLYVENIFRIAVLTPYAARQLATDIDYLCNVFEDLGICLSDDLTSIAALLKASPEEYAAIAEGRSAPIVSAIRGLRNISLVEK